MIKFSTQLTQLFEEHPNIKFSELNDLFGEKSFALAFILLMMTAALPLPTGGVTHFFEVITVLIALELVLGLRHIWIPKRWEKRSIRSPKVGKGMGRVVGVVKFFEKFSRPRGNFISKHHLFVRFVGLVVIALSTVAFLAPPFSGLDTLPALGIVVLSLGLILDDLVITIFGMVVGVVGVVLVVSLAGAAVGLVTRLFH